MTLYSFFSLDWGGFGKKWKQALADFAAAENPDPVIGPWQGKWHTQTNDHTGFLQCILTENEKPDHYDFRFHASWGPFFRCGYHVTFLIEKSEDGFRVEGSEELGKLFGTYEFRGKITGDDFHAEYSSSKGDKGEFKMSRP